jgi:predicted ATP-grasp superfamily ATP-dependent carboligase
MSATSDAALAAIASVARAGYDVTTADVRPMPFGFTSRYARAHYVLDNRTPEHFDRALLDLVERLRPDILLPVGSRPVASCARVRSRLEHVTSFSLAPSDSLDAANDKTITIASCEELGIPCARRLSESEALGFVSQREGTVSVVVKPAANIGAARCVHYVSNRSELEDAVAICRARYGEPFIQEFVAGSNGMKTIVLLFAPDTTLIAALTTAKERQWPASGGLTVVSRSTNDPELVAGVLPFFRKWRWKGPAEVELKHDATTGQDKVIEINPRVPAYLRFAAKCGLDLPAMAVRAVRERVEPLAYPAYKVGVTYLNPGLFLKSAMHEFHRDGASALPRAISHLRSGFPCIVDMLRDPVPFLGRAIEDAVGSAQNNGAVINLSTSASSGLAGPTF